jgi:hypothetical protein
MRKLYLKSLCRTIFQQETHDFWNHRRWKPRYGGLKANFFAGDRDSNEEATSSFKVGREILTMRWAVGGGIYLLD